MRRLKVGLTAALLMALLVSGALAISPDALDRTLKEHERRIALSEERSANSATRIDKLETWTATRLADNDKASAEIRALTGLLQIVATFGIGIITIVIGYLSLKKISQKGD